MDYEMLVKEAYEEIVGGMEKEALNKSEAEAAYAYYFDKYKDRSLEELAGMFGDGPRVPYNQADQRSGTLRKGRKEMNHPAKNVVQLNKHDAIRDVFRMKRKQRKSGQPEVVHAEYVVASKRSPEREARNARMQDLIAENRKRRAADVADATVKSGWRPTGKQIAGGAATVAGLTAAGLTAKALYDRHKRKQKEQAEKAAAYYDEAQFMKQAAEENYLEACAYEEAAVAILDELGYLD